MRQSCRNILNLDYSPFLGEDGTPAGAFQSSRQTTKVQVERRLRIAAEELATLTRQLEGRITARAAERDGCGATAATA